MSSTIYPTVPKAASYVWVLTRGYAKSRVCMMVPLCTICIVRHTICRVRPVVLLQTYTSIEEKMEDVSPGVMIQEQHVADGSQSGIMGEATHGG
jgi:hypothetical protein